jgi:hypothetical protein
VTPSAYLPGSADRQMQPCVELFASRHQTYSIVLHSLIVLVDIFAAGNDRR